MEGYIKDSIDASNKEEVIGLYDKELHLEKLRLSEIEEAEERGKEQGIEQGIEQNRIEIAKNMLKDGMAIEMIKKYTNLSDEQIMN